MYDAAVSIVRRQVGQRLLDDLLRRLDAGERIACAGWTLSPTEATHSHQHFAWGARIRLAPAYQGGLVSVMATDGAKEREVGCYQLERHNAALLPELFEICQRRYAC